ncbi:bleomycin hydrolase, partial [Lecanoromycetidae sp. Uapishka_2]
MSSPEQLAERVETLNANDQSGKTSPEKDYIYVNKNMETPTTETLPEYSPCSETLSISTTEKWEKELMQDPKNRLALSALAGTDPKQVLTQRSAKIADTQSFNIKISLEGAPITNQRSSGRCWLFAATNVFRVAVMRRYNLKEFELSQSYLFFWDKLEKANYFLEQILDTTEEDLEGRLVQTLLAAPVGDGGQWDMVANLVEKYGLVPQHLYPDSHNAMNSSTMGALITTKLREDALKLRELASKSENPIFTLGIIKEKMMREIHLILTLMLGPPPSPDKKMTWEYYDKDDKFGSVNATPLEFAGELSSKATVEANRGADVHELFSLVNDPRNKYRDLLSVSRLGNVVGMRGVRYVNVDMETMKNACISMLKAELPIFFGSDVGKYSDSKSGIMDTELIDYELGFNIRLGLTKAQRLMSSESSMTHAMVLTAVHVIEGKPVRWRVQNSWGDSAGTKGWFVMSDAWMDQFVYQAVVDPKFVSKEITDVLKKEPKMLPLWDPMGALA